MPNGQKKETIVWTPQADNTWETGETGGWVEDRDPNGLISPDIDDLVRIKSASKNEYIIGIGYTVSSRDEYQQYVGGIGRVHSYLKKPFVDNQFNDIFVKTYDNGLLLPLLMKDVELVESASHFQPAVAQKPKPKQIDKFVITDANLSVSEFCARYGKPTSVCFYRGKKSGFPAMEIGGDYRLVGSLEVTVFDNDTVYIRQN